MLKHHTLLLTLVALLFSATGWSQQLSDKAFNPVIENPQYKKGQGPILLLDEAHSNFHTLDGRFSTFAHVLEKDGYVVKASIEPFSSEQLGKGKILVVANALNASNLENWSLPTPPAFTDTEIEAVNGWVKEGGSLFLIADHMPFPGAAESLAASFGFKFYNGFAMKKGGNKAIFSPGNGLIENVITKGRDEKETVTSVQTFTGQAFEIPKDATPIVVLDSKYELKMPQTAWQFEKDTPTISADNLVQGAYMNYGEGRIVLFGEAAMFTAQLQGSHKVGMNQKSAFQNIQFLLNIIHWLDGKLD
ncbi:DUF4350 domain-containing protein [Algoriphagus resistens]|uniref:DUF4350 domain-containing protein n=1 Tax=Algoriphagus resistens TaxID=1750590 RepID=UPI000716C4AD|nr:DUF4350 domain-containing protein [Algoriphagus resistens]